MTEKGAYAGWVKVDKIEKVRVWSSAVPGKKCVDYIDLLGTIQNGKREGEQILDTFREDQQLKTPPKPSKILRIWKAITS